MKNEDRESELASKLIEPFWTKDVNVQILSLLATELNPRTRDVQCLPPFSVCPKSVMSSPDSRGEICEVPGSGNA